MQKSQYEYWLRDVPLCSPDFFDWLNDRFPIIARDSFLVRLLYDSLHIAASGGEIILSQGRIDNLKCRYRSSLPNLQIIEALSIALDTDYLRHSTQRHYCRKIRLPQETALKILAQWHSFRTPKTHIPTTGEPANSFERYHDDYVAHLDHKHKNHPFRSILRYLNRQPMPTLKLDLSEIPDEQKELAYACANRRANVYHPGEREYRLYIDGTSLQNVSSLVRRKLLLGDEYHELDLKSCHLAIAATVLKSPELARLIERGDIYSELAECSGASRDAVKRCVLSMLYGSKQRMQQRILSPSDVSPEIRDYENEMAKTCHSELVSHPAIKDLLERRDERQSMIAAKGLTIAGKNWKVGKDISAKTILFAESTFYERTLIRPIYDYAETATDCAIVLDQHDGVTVRCDAKTVQKLKRLVAQKTAEMNISTHLVEKGEK